MKNDNAKVSNNAPQRNDTSEDDWGVLSDLPGNPVMWLLIWSELFVFGAIFLGFSVARLSEVETFNSAQATLDRLAGAINTMVLITSGFFAALAVNAQSRNKSLQARGWIVATIVLGILFLVIKGMEYADKLAHGYSIYSNNFYMFYYMMTGFHAAHVVFGIGLLAIVGWKNSLENLETGTAFWHMVDLIWVILFPLVYLLR